LDHGVGGSARLQAAVPDERPPGEKAERQPQQRALLCGQLGAKHVCVGRHIRPEAHFGNFSRERMIFGVAQHAGGQVGVAVIPGVKRTKAEA
jgi:hypothetical protein